MGGDHSVSGHIIKEFKNLLQVLNFDAHRDCAPYSGTVTRINIMSYLRTLPQVQHVVTVGIRGIIDLASEDKGPENSSVILAEQLLNAGKNCLKDELDPFLPVYLTFDCDVLDPSIAPLVKCPSVEGLSLRDCRVFIDTFLHSKKIIGIDFVETHYSDNQIQRNLTGSAIFTIVLKILDTAWIH